MIMHKKIAGQPLLLAFGITTLVIAGLVGSDVYAQSNQVTASNLCENQATILNGRTSLLQAYKAKEDTKYKLERNKWAVRISYGAQWVPKDAEKARDSLYKYDDLHRELNKELDKQINDYKYLLDSPLDCTTEPNKLAVAQKVNELTGMVEGKAESGQALLEKLKYAEVKHANGDFKKTSENLVKSMHKAKKKSPKPSNQKLELKNY